MPNSSFHIKPIEDLTFTDDGMFQAVLHEPDICAELVERLLHVKVNRVEYPEIEKQIAPYFTTKGVRLDVYLRDSEKIIDVEMQSYPQEALGKRTRYYDGMFQAVLHEPDICAELVERLPLHLQERPLHGRR